MLRALCFVLLVSPIAFAQDKRPDVHLNHAFVVPDAETYEAIRNSEFVKQFAVWEERTTRRKDITYTGFYLYGRHTYFEFLKPDDRNAVGDSKIAFGVDRTGDLDLLQKRAEAASIKTELKTITRAFNGKDVDWFRSLDQKDKSAPSLGIWTLEYVPTFLSEWNPRTGEKPSVRREDVLKRYAEVVNQQTDKPMEDVTEIWLSVPIDTMERAYKNCKILEFAINWESRPFSLCEKGKELRIYIRPSERPPGIKAVTFVLQKPLPAQEIVIGSTRLRIQGMTAVWIFDPKFQPQKW